MRARQQVWVGVFLVALNAQAAQLCNSPIQAAGTATHPRFAVHEDGTVSDRNSSLMWMACVQGQRWQAGRCVGQPARTSLAQAHRTAEVINRQGDFFYDDWRVPNLRELATITELHCKNPRINLTIFPSTPAAFLWTTTSGLAQGTQPRVFVLSFGPEGYELRHEFEPHFVRYVRTDL